MVQEGSQSHKGYMRRLLRRGPRSAQEKSLFRSRDQWLYCRHHIWLHHQNDRPQLFPQIELQTPQGASACRMLHSQTELACQICWRTVRISDGNQDSAIVDRSSEQKTRTRYIHPPTDQWTYRPQHGLWGRPLGFEMAKALRHLRRHYRHMTGFFQPFE